MDTNDIRIKRQSLFNVDIEYRFFIIKSILEIYEKADKERRELDFDELKRIKDLPCYPDNRQETILGFNFFKLTNKYNIDDLILDAITIMDNLGGKDTKELFSDYCIGDLHGYKVWYEGRDEPDYTLYFSLEDSTSAY